MPRLFLAGFIAPTIGSLLFAVSAAMMGGCESGFTRIDRQVDELLTRTSSSLGPDAYSPLQAGPPPPPPGAPAPPPPAAIPPNSTAEHPETVNPPAEELEFTPRSEAEDVLRRLEAYNVPAADPMPLDLAAALTYATLHSRDYKFAEEQYVITALRLLTERHLWGPRFFDDISADISGSGESGFFDSSLDVVNDFSVTQRLPYGGTISARALAALTEDLHSRVSAPEPQTADIILSANVPLLRGAGLVAREDLIQSERDMIYAARDFENFRRDFLFSTAQDFLDLVVQQQQVINSERQLERVQELEARERSLYESGRTPLFQAALAEQDTVSALDELNNRRESYRLAVDRFKVTLGMSVDQPVAIMPSNLELPVPETDLNRAVEFAFAYRLDLQTQRDVIGDATRGVSNAKNDLLPDLDFDGSVTIPTDDARERAGLRFEPEDSEYRAGLTLSLPLDRKIERVSVRQAQISLERAIRAYDELRDTIAVNVRSSVRDIDLARYTLQIQERNIAIGEQRKASIDAAPDRATARDASEAADELLQAQDRRDSARRDLQVAILRYLVETGQLRVTPDGFIRALSGMPPGSGVGGPPPEEPEEPGPAGGAVPPVGGPMGP